MQANIMCPRCKEEEETAINKSRNIAKIIMLIDKCPKMPTRYKKNYSKFYNLSCCHQSYRGQEKVETTRGTQSRCKCNKGKNAEYTRKGIGLTTKVSDINKVEHGVKIGGQREINSGSPKCIRMVEGSKLKSYIIYYYIEQLRRSHNEQLVYKLNIRVCYVIYDNSYLCRRIILSNGRWRAKGEDVTQTDVYSKNTTTVIGSNVTQQLEEERKITNSDANKSQHRERRREVRNQSTGAFYKEAKGGDKGGLLKVTENP